MGATMAAKSWCLIIAGVWRAGLLAAQLPAADEAFRRGRLAEARASYERVLASDSLNVRALYRLAILDGWDAKLDRSLARFTKLRRLEPRDPDFMVAHARVLSWAGGVAPGDNEARDLARTLRALLRPDVRTSVDGAGDTDHNNFVAQDATVTGALGAGLRGTLRAGWRRATDQVGHGSSYGGGGFVVAALGRRAELRTGAGLRWVGPGIGPSRTPVPSEGGAGVGPGRG